MCAVFLQSLMFTALKIVYSAKVNESFRNLFEPLNTFEYWLTEY